MKDYGITYSAERPEEVDVKSTKVFVASDIKEEKDGGYSYDLTEYDKDEYEAGKKSAPAVRSGEQYFTTLNGYYCKDAAGRALLAELEDIVHPDLVTLNATQNGVYVPTASYGYATVNVNVPFYARTDATLADVSTVEGDEMHVEPTAGTSYYPRLFLMSTPYPNPEQEDPTDRGKYFAPTDANYAVTAYIDIIDIATGESVEGYPKIVNTSSANYGINSGGYIRLKGWKVTTSGNHLKVAVTTTRWNTTYSNPIDDTYSTQSDVETWLSAYTTPPYVIKDDRWAVVDSGSCGTNATYVLYGNGLLEISGTGAIIDSAFYDRQDVESVVINNGITSLDRLAFGNCTALTDITIPDSVTSIGNVSFGNCTALTNITIPDSVTSIGNQAFSNCTALTDITISDSVTSIGIEAFNNCTALTNITIPDSVTSIGNQAFSNCTALTDITILAITPPTAGFAMFYHCYRLECIYVPAESVDAYVVAREWSDDASLIQAIPSGD